MAGNEILKSKQDANQVIRLAFDDATQRLRTDAIVTATIGSVDVIIDAAGGDNIAISDGVDTMAVNPDGSINVNVINAILYSPKFYYNAISAVGASVLTTILSVTIPAGKTGFLQKVTASGENIAKYTVTINGTPIDTARTYFGGSLDLDLNYTSLINFGYPVVAGDIIRMQVIHTRPNVADFNSRMQILENI